MPGGGARPAGPPRRSPRSRRGRGGPPGDPADHAGKRRDGRAARRRAPRAGPATPAAAADRTAPTGPGSAQGGQAAGCHLAQPAPLHLPVEGIPPPARAPPVPGGLPGAGEPGRGVARAGVPGRVGERLSRQHDLVVHLQVVAGQPGQRPGQHRRGQMRPSAGQHAEPLLAGQHRQPVEAVGIRPADHLIPGGAPQHRRPVPRQRHPGAVQHRDVPDHRPEQPRPEPVMSIQQLIEPGDLAGQHQPYRQLAGPGGHDRNPASNPAVCPADLEGAGRGPKAGGFDRPGGTPRPQRRPPAR